ncbi:MAG: hypothetical protein H7Z38_02700 [Rubrivivax sp.]|nr:hypothetical protein [Pyrinomonadaceae bacterium]
MADKQDALQTSETGNQRSLVTHAVLVGLTPLIPVPVLDDLVKSYFRKRLVRALAASNGRSLSEEDLSALASEKETGCLRGCLFAAIVYPLKAVFRKIFYFLEWKRAVDLTSRTYHYGYLVNYAMRRQGDGKSLLDLRRAADVSEAIQAVCLEAPIKPVESAIAGTFRQSHRVLRGAANLLAGSLRGVAGRKRAEQVAEAIEQVEPEEEREIEPVVAGMQRSIAAVPEDHFSRLRAQLDARLGLSSGRA